MTLTNVTVSDPHTGLSTITCAPVAQGGTLSPDATTTCTATYTVTQADVNAGTIDNTGDVVGTPPVGDDVTDDDPLREQIEQTPVLILAKSLLSNADEDGSGTVTLDDTLTYQFESTNNGNVTLTGVTITDTTLPGLSALTCDPTPPATLAPLASMTCTATYVVTGDDVVAGEIINTATANSDQTDTVQIYVRFENTAPTANAGSPQELRLTEGTGGSDPVADKILFNLIELAECFSGLIISQI